jgi:hypothetical protein
MCTVVQWLFFFIGSINQSRLNHSEVSFALDDVQDFVLQLYNDGKMFDDMTEEVVGPQVVTLAEQIAQSVLRNRVIPIATLKPFSAMSLQIDGSVFAEATVDGITYPVCVSSNIVISLWFSGSGLAPSQLLETGVEGHRKVGLLLDKEVRVADVTVDDQGKITAATAVVLP